MTTFQAPLRAALSTAVLALCAAGPAMAQSADFSSWSAHGDVQATASGALLSTAATASSETPLYGGEALQYYELEPLLGTQFDADTYEGSGITTAFTTTGAVKVSASWSLGTSSYDAGFADRAYAIVDGTAIALGVVSAGAVGGSFEYTFASAGSHTLGFALLDVNDVTGVSSLSLSGLSVSAVPEPASYALLLGGLAAVGALARRQRRG